jgi:hypothetical protein
VTAAQLDHHEAIRLLREVVAGREDFVYRPPVFGEGCVYRNEDGQPSCLVGHVLYRWNPTVVPVEENVIGDLDLADDGVTEDAVQVLAAAQDVQDHGEPEDTWGRALAAAEIAYKRLELTS